MVRDGIRPSISTGVPMDNGRACGTAITGSGNHRDALLTTTSTYPTGSTVKVTQIGMRGLRGVRQRIMNIGLEFDTPVGPNDGSETVNSNAAVICSVAGAIMPASVTNVLWFVRFGTTYEAWNGTMGGTGASPTCYVYPVCRNAPPYVVNLPYVVGCATSKWRSSGAACLPVVLKAVVKLTTSEGDDSVSASNGPEHAGLFEASTDYGFAPGFDNAGADKEMLAAELWVAHAGCILGKVVRLDTELLDDFRVGGGDGAQGENQLLSGKGLARCLSQARSVSSPSP